MEKTNFLFLILFFCISFSIEKFEVIINEVCTNNENILKNSYDTYSPWVELYNPGENLEDLSGYGLSNEEYIPLKWTFPLNTMIEPKKYLIVFFSEEKSLNNEELHASFQITNDKEQLFFNDPNGKLIEKLEIPELSKDISYGRTVEDIFQKMIPTPYKKNKMPIEAPIFSKESGFYNDEFLLTLSTNQGSEIYYTTDSSNPLNSTTVQKYKDPIKIYDRTSEPNVYAEIGDDENSPLFIGSFGGYKRPKYLIDKAMVIRAFCKNKDGNSTITDHIYFITTGNLEQYQNFTIVSLVVNPEDLFDPDKGIYVVGNDYIEAKKNLNPNDFQNMFQLMYASNFYKEGPEWEKLTDMTIFEKGNIILKQNVGIRIRGFSTKMQAGKSFNVYAKKRFGYSSIKNVLFNDNYNWNNKLIKKYKSIALRNVFAEERIKDEFTNKLLFGREFQSIADTRKCIVFLNGEYWGFYILLEKFSESYIESHFDVPKESVTLIKEGELSNGEESEVALYTNFFSEYSKKDLLNEKVYEEINNFIDIDSLIEHFVIGIYLGTWDWPGHNDGVWRYNGDKIENNPYSDGRWRYISFDFDYTMGASSSGMWGQQPQQAGYEKNDLKDLEMRKNVPTILFLPLLKNEDFRNKYVLRFCDYVNDVFSLDRIDSVINDYIDNYLDKLANGKVRWKGYEYEDEKEAFANYKTSFSKNFDDIRKYFELRPKYALQHMKEYLDLDGELEEITIIKEGQGEGKIKINSITPEFKDGKWVGKYFSDIPITITAIPSEKSKFKGWSGDIDSKESTILLDLNQDTEIIVKFE